MRLWVRFAVEKLTLRRRKTMLDWADKS